MKEPQFKSQKGFVLVTALLLLVVVTVIGVSMLRSFGVQQRISTNLREKRRALNAAESAQQYAEWWLSTGNNASTTPVVCAALLNANLGQGQICANTLPVAVGNVTTLPWVIAGQSVGVTYTPPTMTVAAAAAAGTYNSPPVFYISALGTAADGLGQVYQVDAVGYGGTSSAVAVVESTFEVAQGVISRGGL